MAGFFFAIVCASFPLQASEGHEQSERTTLQRSAEIFRANARDANTLAEELEEQADQTDAFIKSLRARLGRLTGNRRVQLAELIDPLVRQRDDERERAATAASRAAELKAKADIAERAVTMLLADADSDESLSAEAAINTTAPPGPSPPQDDQQRMPLSGSLAFGSRVACIIANPWLIAKDQTLSKGTDLCTRLHQKSEISANGAKSPFLDKAEWKESGDGRFSTKASIDVSQEAGETVAAALPSDFAEPGGIPISGVSLTAAETGTRLGLKISVPRGGKWLTCNEYVAARCDGNTKRLNHDQGYLNSYSFGVSTESKEKFAELFGGGSGFDDDVRGSFGYTHTRYEKRSPKQILDDLNSAEKKLRENCLKARGSSISRPIDLGIEASCTGEALRKWVVADGDDEDKALLQNAVWGHKRPEMKLGGAVEIGYQAFDFRDFGSTEPDQLDETQPFGRTRNQNAELVWELSASAGWFHAFDEDEEARLYGGFVAEFGRKFDYADDNRNQIRCPAAEIGETIISCQTLNTGPPVKNMYYRVGLEGKRTFALPFVGDVAVAPRFTYDLDDDQVRIEMPMLFVKNDKKQLFAGLRVSGEAAGNDPEDLSVGLFISTPFQLE
ncbi:MAG: hypothetical protein WA906_07240 [Pacificimonas sp.]